MMNKITKIAIGASIAVGIMSTAIAFAQTTFTTPTNPNSSANIASKIACVGSAVNNREQAFDTAITTYTSAINSAYSARATALQSAYSNSNWKDVKIAVNAAWKNFRTSKQSANANWRIARTSAWRTFYQAVKVCKAPAHDSGNANSEVSGN